MKKLFAVLTALLPLIYISEMFAVLKLENDDLLMPAAGAYLLFGLIVHIIHVVLSTTAEKEFLAISNLWIIGVNLVLNIVEVIILIITTIDIQIQTQQGAQEGGLLVALLFMFCIPHWITYGLTRITASINCSRALTDICNNTVESVHILLHLFPITDMISAILVLRKVKAFLSFQQPPIETE